MQTFEKRGYLNVFIQQYKAEFLSIVEYPSTHQFFTS